MAITLVLAQRQAGKKRVVIRNAVKALNQAYLTAQALELQSTSEGEKTQVVNSRQIYRHQLW